MKINKIGSLFLASLVLLFSGCEPEVDEMHLENSTDVAGVELIATQSTPGGNKITLNMDTPGVTGYWDYNLGKALTNKTTFVYPIPGTATFTYVGTLGSEFFTKTIEVEVEQLDNALDQDWYDLVGENTAEGKTWVFNGGPAPDGRQWWFMSPPGDKAGAWTIWWNAAGDCCPPVDASGKMKFDLGGAANYTYYPSEDAEGQTSSFVLDVANQKLIINDGNILGAEAPWGNPAGVYEIVSLTEDELVLYVPSNEGGTGWTWVFVPEGSRETGEEPTESATTSFPVDFETAANGGAADNWAVFENGDNPALEIISNPDMTGNTSSTVAKFTARQDGQPWAGTETVLESPFTLDASNSTVKIWVWKSVISDVAIKFANAAGGSSGEIKVANTKTDEWEELTFDFSGVIGDPNNTDITNLVVFPDFQDRSQENVVYFDNITLNSSSGGDSGDGGSTGTLGLPLNFDGSEDYVGSSSGVDFDVVTNPQQSGINSTATMVGEVINEGSQYEALTIALDNAIDFSGSNKTITMKVYSETAYPVLFKLETGVNGERANEVEVSHGGTGWEELTFDFNNARKSYIDGNQGAGEAFVPTGQYATFSIFLDFAGTTAGTFYIDDIEHN